MPESTEVTGVETFSVRIVESLEGSKPADSYGAVDWAKLIELVATIITSLLMNCPASSDVKVVGAAKSPEFMQRVRFRSEVRSAVRGSGVAAYRDRDGVLADAIIAGAAGLTDGEASAVVFEARNPNWILV